MQVFLGRGTTTQNDRWFIATVVICVCLLSALPAKATDKPLQLAIGYTAGAVALDNNLTNYRWSTTPRFETGIEAALIWGRFAAGARVLHTNTTQATGIPGETTTPQVSLVGTELVGQYRVLSYRGVSLSGSAHGGMMHMGYNPDRLTFDAGGIAPPISVSYKPIWEPVFGVGVVVGGHLTDHLALGLQAEQSTFSLDTSHRLGNQIIEERERFYNWSLRLRISWVMRLR